MKKILAPLIIILLCSAFASNSSPNWGISLNEAKTNAEQQGKYILLSFQGSDWCSNCMKLEKSLFESEDFNRFALDNLVLLKADFPMKRQNKLSKEQTIHNEALAEKFNKKGTFPQVVILNEMGELVGTMEHPLPSASAYIENIKSIIK